MSLSAQKTAASVSLREKYDTTFNDLFWALLKRRHQHVWQQRWRNYQKIDSDIMRDPDNANLRQQQKEYGNFFKPIGNSIIKILNKDEANDRVYPQEIILTRDEILAALEDPLVARYLPSKEHRRYTDDVLVPQYGDYVRYFKNLDKSFRINATQYLNFVLSKNGYLLRPGDTSFFPV